VERRQWLDAQEFEDAIAACNLLPGPASTELAIFCAWRVRGRVGALAGGLAFILPGLACILALSALFLAGTPPLWVKGAGAGAGAAVAAVAVQAGWTLLRPSWARAGKAGRARQVRWAAYLLAGGAAAATIGPWLVLVLLGCGLAELALRRPRGGIPGQKGLGAAAGTVRGVVMLPALAAAAAGGGVLAGVAWVAFKVGALSFGGGFVIIPLMRADAVGRGWMTGTQFLNAVALGQITPGPVVQTVSAVGYAAAGLGGGLLAALVAFSPLVRLRAGRRRVLQRAAHQPGRAGVPGRRRTGRDRGDPGLGHPARRDAARAVAVRGAGRRGGAAARPGTAGSAARGGAHPAGCGRDRAARRAGGRAAADIDGVRRDFPGRAG
jgi:chromate transporter